MSIVLYKVIVKTRNTMFHRYFKAKEEARDYINSVNNIVGVVKSCKQVHLTLHHSALARGYCRKDSARNEDYQGKFGVGYIEHVPTKWSDCSNSYHKIRYYLED